MAVDWDVDELDRQVAESEAERSRLDEATDPYDLFVRSYRRGAPRGGPIDRDLEVHPGGMVVARAPRTTTKIVQIPMAPSTGRGLDAYGNVLPRSATEVARLQRQKIITKREAREYLGLPTRWWRRGR